MKTCAYFPRPDDPMVAATRASRASAATLRRGLAAAPPKLAAMKRPFDPRRADVAALATGHAHHAGSLGLSDLPRLREDEPPGFELQTSPIVWRIDAEARPVTGGEPQLRLHLQAHGSVWRECQRCLQPVAIALVVDRPLRFVRGEDAAAALDADNDEEDVLDLKPRIDLVELITSLSFACAPNASLIALVSFRSPSGVEVPCALRY